MIYTLKISDEVLTDVSDILNWYDLISRKVSKRFEVDLINRLKYLEDNPLKFQIRYNKVVRIAPLKGFPYGIHYYLEANIIHVVAVFHYKISPDRWKRRTQS